ncbi:Panacea domain-containing protein [Flavobacterium sp. PLA-1-15]|uniref:Panacea domain-containing protein n=1 Tax=Flavobacterium sp. PLA-1-15 TaxID=3380533 RepID=UPI003B81AEFB
MKTNVFDVANYILLQTGQITTMKLQKLLYYCQAWSLVWDEKPLFPEEIQAWANGPVVPELYNAHRGFFEVVRFKIGDAVKVQGEAKETIDKVLEAFADKPAKWLIDLTHLESPWIDARAGLGSNDRSNVVITKEAMFDYYSSL